jgi:DNA-binding response OmpR family regulator
LPGARILVADDDEATARLLEAVLKRDGCSVVWAPNGKVALETAQAGEFDLILLDVPMPEMDGHETCRALRADPRFQATPIVMLTGLAQDEDVMAGFAQGVTDYMTKPFAISQVRARVRSWLTRSAEQVH